ncbi:MAG: hypothetical protein IJ618_07430 [Prevotella sp.]|nr:hypothetical protein [Prevotella sp.]
MIDPSLKWKKLGDVLCDIGKYLLTVIPFSYFMADRPNVVYVLLSTAIGGVAFIIFGIYFNSYASDLVSGKTKKRKVKLLKNSVFVIEEQNPE